MNRIGQPGRLARRMLWKSQFRRRGASSYWRMIEEFEDASPEVQRRIMGGLLRAQLEHFGARQEALPEWRSLAGESAEAVMESWSKLPIVTKADLRDRFEARQLRDRHQIRGVVSATGGSTGEPTPYLHDVAMMRATAAARAFARMRMGWKPGVPLVVLWGSERDIGRRQTFRGRVRSWLQGSTIIDGYALDDRTVDRFVAAVRRNAPVAVYGFTTMLDFVARRLLERGQAMAPGSVTAAWNGGEMLTPEQSHRFERAVGVPILNYYGGRELSAIAFQDCPGSPLRVIRPLLLLEVVDPEGRPVPEGESGRILLTSTVCRGTPFLRYEVGDLGRAAVGSDSEAGVGALSGLEGRTAGVVQLPNGRTVNNLYWNHLFKESSAVHQFQVVVERGGGILLRLRGVPMDGDQQRTIVETVRAFTGLPVRVEWLDRIPLTSQGKLVQVVVE